MNRLPPWVRSSTRPTTDEIDRVIGELDPELARFARDATAPSAHEIALLRRREPRRSPNGSLTALAVVLAGAMAMGLLWMEPESLVVTERPMEAGIYRVTTADELTPILGVWVKGEGSVEVGSDGRLGLAGDLLLTVTAPVSFDVGHETFSADDAIVWVDGTGLRVAAGQIEGAGRVWTAGERWTFPEAAVALGRPAMPPVMPGVVETPSAPPERVEVEEAPTPAPVIAPTPEPIRPPEVAVRTPDLPTAIPDLPPATPVAPVPAAPAPAVPDEALAAALGWRDVLIRLEKGGTRDDRIAALRSYRTRYPESPFDPEAEALMLLIPGADGDPRARLGDLERWLGRNPSAARSVEVHALAARIAREGLQDCAKSAPHDRAVAAGTSGAPRAKAEAFLGLCEIASGRSTEGRALLDAVDTDLLDPALRRAVADARSGGAE